MPEYIKDDNYRKADKMWKLCLIEFAVGSLGLSRRQGLIEMGFPEDVVDELMSRRLVEDGKANFGRLSGLSG